jgi:hypothetical protein
MVLTPGSFRGEVVEQDFLRKGKKNFLRGLLMNRILRITIHRCFVFEPHDKADVERSVSPRTRFRQWLADGEELHFGYLARKRVRRRDEFLPLLLVARLFQPYQADVINFAGFGAVAQPERKTPMASAMAAKASRVERLFETGKTEFPSRLCFMLFPLLSDQFVQSCALGNPTTGVGLRLGFDTSGLFPLVFNFRFLLVRAFRFTPPLCRIASDASKTSLLSNQCR